MRTYYIVCSFLMLSFYGSAQEFSSYERPIEMSLYSEALGDTVRLEITLPNELNSQANTEYPVLYLLDRQLNANYTYNLHTLDYLSTLQWMPKAIIVGITFPWRNRNSWTSPNESGGKADDLIFFLENKLNRELKKKYPLSNFNLLIGHSRTAIFSSYALSKRPDFFNGIIASSVSNFDFGDNLQKEQFEVFLNMIPSVTHDYYYYFSVGEEAFGDLHESSVDTLNAYLSAKELPKNLKWKFYKHQIAHSLTPGVTVANSLSDIFKEYGRRMDVCFDLAKGSTAQVPWDEFLNLYASISSELGFTIEPSELFYNSIASEYYNDYDGIYGKKNLDFALVILWAAIEMYPLDYDYHSWIGEIYMTRGEFEKGELHLNKAVELIKKDTMMSEADRTSYLKEIEALKETN